MRGRIAAGRGIMTQRERPRFVSHAFGYQYRGTCHENDLISVTDALVQKTIVLQGNGNYRNNGSQTYKARRLSKAVVSWDHFRCSAAALAFVISHRPQDGWSLYELSNGFMLDARRQYHG